MWFCRHIIPTVGVLLTFGLGCFKRKSFLSPKQRPLLKQAITDAPNLLRKIFAKPEEPTINILKILCAIKPLLTTEEISQLPECSKDLTQRYPGVQEICKSLHKPSGKNIMEFLTQPTHNHTDPVLRLNQLDAALSAYGWIQVDPQLKGQSLIKEFRTLIS
jgi:hypothetical protein